MENKIEEFLGIDDLKDYRTLFKQLISEFLGTFFYLALVLSSGIGYGTSQPNVVIAMANGFLVATVIQIFGHVSGGHVNPAVTLGALVCARIKPMKAVFYVIVQVLGSILGAAVAYAVSSDAIKGNLGATVPFPYSKAVQIFVLEFLMTFLLVAVVLSVTDYARGARGLGSSSLAIGICITGCLCSSLPYTGSLNPVRTLGPAVVMNIHHMHWVYWVAPLLGGLVAGLVYRCVLGVCRKNLVLEQE
ncbi:hypothetical protein PYW07_012451 [Mythimna separata]|uniref:Aquaporin n=1 Tax=Mythimna separata TaxID=271217 RepID=A0AAD7YMC7_MYTSE|nr:hypothetical protein PYW07_012451 [Mythimna separata]